MPDPYWENVRKEVEQRRALENLARAPKEHGPAGKVGERMFRCEECGHRQYEHWIVRTRAARPRCPGCGSLRYEPYTKEAKDDIADLNDVKKSLDGPKGTGGGSFIVGS